MRVQQETDDIRGRLISFFYRGKLSALFRCLGRVDINYLFSWLFYDLRKSTHFCNRIFSMKSTLFRNTKSHLFSVSNKLFSTFEVILKQTQKCALHSLNYNYVSVQSCKIAELSVQSVSCLQRIMSRFPTIRYDLDL